MAEPLVLNYKDNAWLLFDGEYTIGRSQRSAIYIEEKGVSRQHCRILVQGERCQIEDLGSSFGTLVNGKLAKEALLRPGDRIRLGDALLTVETFTGTEQLKTDVAQQPSEVRPSLPSAEGSVTVHEAAETEAIVFCTKCNLPNLLGDKACVHCGQALATG